MHDASISLCHPPGWNGALGLGVGTCESAELRESATCSQSTLLVARQRVFLVDGAGQGVAVGAFTLNGQWPNLKALWPCLTHEWLRAGLSV